MRGEKMTITKITCDKCGAEIPDVQHRNLLVLTKAEDLYGHCICDDTPCFEICNECAERLEEWLKDRANKEIKSRPRFTHRFRL